MLGNTLQLRNRIGAASTAATVSVLTALPAAAQTLQQNLQATGQAAFPGQSSDANRLPQIIGQLIKAGLTLIGVVLVVIIIYSGWQYMTAGGEEGKVEDAKKRIINAVIGMIIIFAAYAITNFVIGAILTGTGTAEG